jgi:hypothetical protein
VNARRCFFHGGIPGLQPGDELLAGRETGHTTRRLIWVTADWKAARGYAARFPDGGDVYVVDIEPPHPDDQNPLMQESAKTTRSAVVRRALWRGVTDPRAMPRMDLPNPTPQPIRRRANAQ